MTLLQKKERKKERKKESLNLANMKTENMYGHFFLQKQQMSQNKTEFNIKICQYI